MAGTDTAQILREGHDAFNNRDRDRLLEHIAEDVTWHSSGNSPMAGTFEGRDELWERFFAPAWEAPLSVEDDQVLGTDEYAVSQSRLKAKMGDDERTWKLIELVHVEDGELTERWSYVDRQDELDQFLQQAAQQGS